MGPVGSAASAVAGLRRAGAAASPAAAGLRTIGGAAAGRRVSRAHRDGGDALDQHYGRDPLPAVRVHENHHAENIIILVVCECVPKI